MVRHQGYQVRWSTCHDMGLDDHRSNTQKSLKFAVKWLLGPKFSSPAARFKGLRLGERGRQPRIRYPNRHHHPCMDQTTSRRPESTCFSHNVSTLVVFQFVISPSNSLFSHSAFAPTDMQSFCQRACRIAAPHEWSLPVSDSIRELSHAKVAHLPVVAAIGKNQRVGRGRSAEVIFSDFGFYPSVSGKPVARQVRCEIDTSHTLASRRSSRTIIRAVFFRAALRASRLESMAEADMRD